MRALIALLVATPVIAGAQHTRTARDSSRVVFVCEHGTVKSLVALEYFNRLARARHLPLAAISRGTTPDTAVPRSVANGLTADGFDVSAFRPRRFTSEDLSRGLLVVALDADVDPVVDKRLPVLRWDGLPSVTANYGVARSAIAARVEKLVDSLAATRRRK